MVPDDGGIERLTLEERRLIHNYRIVNETRQDTLLYFSDELVKLEVEETRTTPANVVKIHRK